MENYLYHPTLTKNLSSILATGLKAAPQPGRKAEGGLPDGRLNVALTLQAAELFADHLASHFGTGAVVLRFAREGFALLVDEDEPENPVIDAVVPPGKIEVATEEAWMPLAKMVAGMKPRSSAAPAP